MKGEDEKERERDSDSLPVSTHSVSVFDEMREKWRDL